MPIFFSYNSFFYNARCFVSLHSALFYYLMASTFYCRVAQSLATFNYRLMKRGKRIAERNVPIKKKNEQVQVQERLNYVHMCILNDFRVAHVILSCKRQFAIHVKSVHPSASLVLTMMFYEPPNEFLHVSSLFFFFFCILNEINIFKHPLKEKKETNKSVIK